MADDRSLTSPWRRVPKPFEDFSPEAFPPPPPPPRRSGHTALRGPRVLGPESAFSGPDAQAWPGPRNERRPGGIRQRGSVSAERTVPWTSLEEGAEPGPPVRAFQGPPRGDVVIHYPPLRWSGLTAEAPVGSRTWSSPGSFGAKGGVASDKRAEIYFTAGKRDADGDPTCNTSVAHPAYHGCKVYKLVWDLEQGYTLSVEQLLLGRQGLSRREADEQYGENAYGQPNLSPDGKLLTFRVREADDRTWRLGLHSLKYGWTHYSAATPNEEHADIQFPAFYSDRYLLFHEEDDDASGRSMMIAGSLYVVKIEGSLTAEPSFYGNGVPAGGTSAGTEHCGWQVATSDAATDFSSDGYIASTGSGPPSRRVAVQGVRLAAGRAWDSATSETVMDECSEGGGFSTVRRGSNESCATPMVIGLSFGRSEMGTTTSVETFANYVSGAPWPEDMVSEDHLIYGCHHTAWHPDFDQILCTANQYPAASQMIDLGERAQDGFARDRGVPAPHAGGWTRMLWSFSQLPDSVASVGGCTSPSWFTSGLLFRPPWASELDQRVFPLQSDQYQPSKCFKYTYKFGQWLMNTDAHSRHEDRYVVCTVFCESGTEGESDGVHVTSRIFLINIKTSEYWDLTSELEDWYDDERASWTSAHATGRLYWPKSGPRGDLDELGSLDPAEPRWSDLWTGIPR